MITIIIPTRNRGYTLERVASSYFTQKNVSEIIFVDDAGDDNTESLVASFAKTYPNILTKYIRHSFRQGASAARITGYENCSNEYILFGEDDAYLDENYAVTLHSKITLSEEPIHIISGRIIYMEPAELRQAAKQRFGIGINRKKYLNKKVFGFNPDAVFSGDLSVPFTHALFLTSKSLLNQLKYDPHYGKGSGYREETDFQMNAFVNDFKIVVTNDTHCFHLHTQDVQTGGQRVNKLKKLYWCIIYTNYFYDKYYNLFRPKLGLRSSRMAAKFYFAVYQTYSILLRPALRPTINVTLKAVLSPIKRLMKSRQF